MNSRTARRTVCLLAALFAGGAIIVKIFPPPALKDAGAPQVIPVTKASSGPSAPFATAPTGPRLEPAVAPAALSPLAERDRGYEAIAALQDSGRFVEAASYAAAGATSWRRDWLNAAYFAWSRRQPEAALQAAARLDDPTAREIAVQSVWSGWAQADPAGLADVAMNFPDGSEKSAALTKALRSWMHADPARAGDWIFAHRVVIPIAEFVFQSENR